MTPLAGARHLFLSGPRLAGDVSPALLADALARLGPGALVVASTLGKVTVALEALAPSPVAAAPAVDSLSLVAIPGGAGEWAVGAAGALCAPDWSAEAGVGDAPYSVALLFVPAAASGRPFGAHAPRRVQGQHAGDASCLVARPAAAAAASGAARQAPGGGRGAGLTSRGRGGRQLLGGGRLLGGSRGPGAAVSAEEAADSAAARAAMAVAAAAITAARAERRAALERSLRETGLEDVPAELLDQLLADETPGSGGDGGGEGGVAADQPGEGAAGPGLLVPMLACDALSLPAGLYLCVHAGPVYSASVSLATRGAGGPLDAPPPPSSIGPGTSVHSHAAFRLGDTSLLDSLPPLGAVDSAPVTGPSDGLPRVAVRIAPAPDGASLVVTLAAGAAPAAVVTLSRQASAAGSEVPLLLDTGAAGWRAVATVSPGAALAWLPPPGEPPTHAQAADPPSTGGSLSGPSLHSEDDSAWAIPVAAAPPSPPLGSRALAPPAPPVAPPEPSESSAREPSSCDAGRQQPPVTRRCLVSAPASTGPPSQALFPPVPPHLRKAAAAADKEPELRVLVRRLGDALGELHPATLRATRQLGELLVAAPPANQAVHSADARRGEGLATLRRAALGYAGVLGPAALPTLSSLRAVLAAVSEHCEASEPASGSASDSAEASTRASEAKAAVQEVLQVCDSAIETNPGAAVIAACASLLLGRLLSREQGAWASAAALLRDGAAALTRVADTPVLSAKVTAAHALRASLLSRLQREGEAAIAAGLAAVPA